jgi:biotin operon repressor
MQTKTKQETALQMLKRKSGATVEQLAERLELSSTKAARGVIDRLRAKGTKIENIGDHRFKLAA